MINVDPRRDITATVAPANLPHGHEATVSMLASPNITDENNPTEPTHVAITRRTVEVGAGNFELTFPMHSVTAIRLSP